MEDKPEDQPASSDQPQAQPNPAPPPAAMPVNPPQGQQMGGPPMANPMDPDAPPPQATYMGQPMAPVYTGPGLPQVVWVHTRLFFGRIVRSNFLGGGVSQKEAEDLESVGVTHRIPQNFLAWRRALLWFGSITLALAVILGAFTRFEGISQVHGLVATIYVLVYVAEIGACALAIIAALKWTDVYRSRQFARFAWVCLFLVPVILFLIPIAPFLKTPRFMMPGQMGPQGQMAFMAVYLLLPKIIGLFPAVIRSSLSLKSLLPESTMPGWVAVLVAPFYALFFILFLVVVMQMGDILLILCVGALATAPILIVFSIHSLVQPCTEEQALQIVRNVRLKVSIANLVGIGAGILYGINAIKMLGFLDLIVFLTSVFAAIFLVTVVASDVLIGIFKTAFVKDSALREGNLADNLTKRFSDLDEIGLTTISAGEGNFFKNMKNRMAGGQVPMAQQPPMAAPMAAPVQPPAENAGQPPGGSPPAATPSATAAPQEASDDDDSGDDDDSDTNQSK